MIYLLIVAIVEFGRLFSGAQNLQSAVDQAARELSRVPLTPTATFATALADPQVINGVYDPNYLAINISGMQPGQSIFDFFAAQGITLPSVNQALLPMMFNDTVGGVPLLRYPGALLTSTTPTGTKPGYSGFTVAVPLVTSCAGRKPRDNRMARRARRDHRFDGKRRVQCRVDTSIGALRRRRGRASQLSVSGGDNGRLSTAAGERQR